MPIAALEATPVDLSEAERGLASAIIRLVSEEAGPLISPPPGLRLEVEIAAGAATSTDTINKFGHPSTLTCPDCGGVLSEVNGAHALRFRCQVGHAYTAKTLLAEQQGAVDEAMRVALRIIEERANLVARMGRDAESSGRSGIADDYLERARDYRAQAEVLRRALIQLMELKSDESGEAGVTAYEATAGLRRRS